MNTAVFAIGYTNSQNINLDHLLKLRTNLNAKMNQNNQTAKYVTGRSEGVGPAVGLPTP